MAGPRRAASRSDGRETWCPPRRLLSKDPKDPRDAKDAKDPKDPQDPKDPHLVGRLAETRTPTISCKKYAEDVSRSQI